MIAVSPAGLRRNAAVGLSAALLALGACGSGDAEVEATVDDIDQTTSIEVTQQEMNAFRAPADSVVTAAQVEAYLKTTLLQFDLVRRESAAWHGKAKEMEQRAEKGGTLGALRNLAAASSMMYDFGNTVGGSYVRSARTLGYNPAEMDWVRERLGEVSAYLMVKPMQEAAQRGAQEMKSQAEQMRAQLRAGTLQGFTEADVEQMIASANELQVESYEAARAVRANIEVLQRARPAVSEPMWVAVGMAGGTMGLAALTGLGDPNDAEAQAKLDEFRRLFDDALNNRTTAGMEPTPAGG